MIQMYYLLSEKLMEKIENQFKYIGNPISLNSFGEGHINKSFFVKTDADKTYVLQCISSVAFHDVPGLMKNALLVSKHIANKGGNTLDFIQTKNDQYFYVDSNNDYWRSYELIDAICLQHPETPDDFYQSAVAFGNFQNMLDDFPAECLCETIPNFHNTPFRFSQLHEAIDKDAFDRAKNAVKEIKFALEREDTSNKLVEMLYHGELPLRVTHNDTKINNVLLNSKTRQAMCVIDLDTVMPGLSAFDFGDAIRFGASTCREDEPDASKVKLDLNLFRLFTRGFLESFPILSEKEIEVLPDGARMMTLECGVRFLTDYLNGDTYFRINYPTHNLVRARTQFALVKDMEDHFDEMKQIIKEESMKKL